MSPQQGRNRIGRQDEKQQLQRLGFSGRSAVVAVPYVWLLLFFLVPFIFVLKISLAEALIARPPYSSLIEWSEETYVSIRVNFANFLLF